MYSLKNFRIVGLSFLFLLLLSRFPILCWGGETNRPRLSSPVVDLAHIFDQTTIRYVESELHRLQNQGGPQIQVLTVESLDGESIEQYTIQIMEQEKTGNANEDDGLLFLISKVDRKMRIEVGQGLEGALPDVNAKRIIEDSIKPLFRQGQMDQGLVVGLKTITSQVAPQFVWSQGTTVHNRRSTSNKRIPDVASVILFIVFFLFSFFFRRRGGFFGHGPNINTNSWTGGGRGWGGGGGGFSGGGASGDW
jgi:uncharacterized protein